METLEDGQSAIHGRASTAIIFRMAGPIHMLPMMSTVKLLPFLAQIIPSGNSIPTNKSLVKMIQILKHTVILLLVVTIFTSTDITAGIMEFLSMTAMTKKSIKHFLLDTIAMLMPVFTRQASVR